MAEDLILYSDIPITDAWIDLCETQVNRWSHSELEPTLISILVAGKKILLRKLLLERASKFIRDSLVTDFWNCFNGFEDAKFETNKEDYATWLKERVMRAIDLAHDFSIELQESFEAVDRGIERVEGKAQTKTSMREEFFVLFDALVFNAESSNFHPIFTDFFGYLYAQHHIQWKKNIKAEDIHIFSEEDIESDEEDEIYGYDPLSSEITTIFGTKVQELRWLGGLEEAFTNILYHEIDKKVTRVCKGQFEVHSLSCMTRWLESAVFSWLEKLVMPTNPKSENYEVQNSYFIQWKIRLSFHMYEAFGKMRIEELFDIVKVFPDSLAALEDLKQCLERTLQHSELMINFRDALKRRLLQQGANTSQIIDVYISTIKALRILDPRGVVLETVSDPIKEYLRKRKDTVRCIVTSLTDDSSSELFEELGKGGFRPIEHQDDLEEDEECIETAPEWNPDPIEANPKKTSKSRSSDDILSIMVGIYDSKELFVNEYRLMLADKLLRTLDYNTDREIHKLELLKLRFGELSLQQCEIMARDIDESKRINNNIHETIRGDKKVNMDSKWTSDGDKLSATIVSHHFWPPFQGEEFLTHYRMENHLETYKRRYGVVKNPRCLNWVPYLGTVELSLEFDGGIKSFTTSPLHATIIMHFEEQDTWTLYELATKMDISESTLSKKINYWINHGIIGISTTPSTYFLITSQTSSQCNPMLDEDDVTAASSTDAQESAELKILETYICSMLSNLGTLQIDRIHSMLTTFTQGASQRYTKSLPELSKFLRKLVEDGILECIGGHYQLLKKRT